jgi:type IV pilus assembly protein PilM
MAKTLVGLEITEESVRAVEVTAGRRPVLLACGEVPLPAGAAKDSEVLDQDAVALAIRALWMQAGIKGRNVTVGIGSRRVLVREYTAPAMSAAMIKEALPFQVQDLLPVPVNQAVLDFYPIAEADGQVQGLLVAAVSETVEEIVATVKKAKLTVDAVDLAPFGLARVAKVIAPTEESLALVHIGEHTSFIVVAFRGVPHFVRIIPAEVQTEATERRMNVEVLQEEPVEVSVVTDRGGRASLRVAAAESHKREVIGSMTQRAVAELVNRIRSTIAFYDGRSPDSPVIGIRLSGAGAANPAISSAIATATGLPTELVALTDVIESRIANPPAGETAFNLVTTLGITLGEGY